MISVKDLIRLVEKENFIFIQPHDYPDPDAIASAYALQVLLGIHGVKAHLVYEGEIQRDSLKIMINDLGIHCAKPQDYEMAQLHKIIIVDGAKGNKNVTNLIAEEIAVIDHHDVIAPEKVAFMDIRSDYGSCCALVYSYYKELDLLPPKNVASALLIGLNTDTARLTRKVSHADFVAFSELFKLADIEYVNFLLRNNIELADLEFFRHTLRSVHIQKFLAFCYFPEGCSQNLLGILGDFLLSLGEVNFVFLCARNQDRINFSLRNEIPQKSASRTIQAVLEGIGTGGGHADMAGGMMMDLSKFNKEEILGRLTTLLGV